MSRRTRILIAVFGSAVIVLLAIFLALYVYFLTHLRVIYP